MALSRNLAARQQHRPQILRTPRKRRNATFDNKPAVPARQCQPCESVPDDGCWSATGDLGVYIDGELYLTGRIKDLVIIDGRNHYPHDIETTVSEASPAIRTGYVAAFSVPTEAVDSATGNSGEQLVIIAERAAGVGRAPTRASRGGRAGSGRARASGPGRRRPTRRRRRHSPPPAASSPAMLAGSNTSPGNSTDKFERA